MIIKENNIFFPALWAATLLVLLIVFQDSLQEMIGIWSNTEEYSHGFFIPAISAYFIWLRRRELHWVQRWQASVLGVLILLCGLFLNMLGALAALRAIQHYAFILSLTGIFAAAFGKDGLKTAGVPLLFLAFMVPFPEFILNNLSSKLQLISSWLGVEFIRLFGILVYLQGNVIDLGGYKLQVVEACSGLRYLFPLASLSFLCAYLFKGPFWQKALVFLSSMPLTVFMNSFRVGVIGILVNYWGKEMAEGFLHDFEGWVVFLMCMGLLFVEMWLFAKISGRNTAFADLVQLPDEWFKTAPDNERAPQQPAYYPSAVGVLLLLVVLGFSSEWLRGGDDKIPQRKSFLNFPTDLANWHGTRDYLERMYIDTLKLTDYVVMNYVTPDNNEAINFYSAYYQSQRKGASVHSPRSCMPGDGWQIKEFDQRTFADIVVDGVPLSVNRAMIEKGESRQLVYYWFQQRGRMITNEYLLKWYLFWDALTLHRTDGSLVRLVTNIDKTQDAAAADQRLQSFLKSLETQLPAYIPGREAVAQ
jgi:exosortase D (VPLPA-CTERM-specific)